MMFSYKCLGEHKLNGKLPGLHFLVSFFRLDDDVISNLPRSSIETSMWRARSKALPVLPTSLTHFAEILNDPQFSGRFATAHNGEPFQVIGCDGDGREGQAAIIISSNFREALVEATDIHLDGHFKMVPGIPGTYQLLTIMAVSYDIVVPAVSILMTRKTQEAYTMVLRKVAEAIPGFSPTYVMCDYERALFQAVADVFVEAIISGCLFHIDQAMCRWTATTGGLLVYLRETPMAGLLVRMCMALPLLRPDRIQGAFDDVCRFSRGARDQNLFNTMEAFLDYIQNTWIDGIGPEHISVYRRRRRTNNDQESYHKTLVDTLGTPHGNAWAWMDKFRHHEQRQRRRLLQASVGNNPGRAQRKQYALLNKRIARATDRLDQGRISAIQFLKICSHQCHSTYNRVALRVKRDRRAEGADELIAEMGEPIPEEEMGPPPALPPGVADPLDPPAHPVDISSDEEGGDSEEEDNPFLERAPAGRRQRRRAAAPGRGRGEAAGRGRGGRGGPAGRGRGGAGARGRGGAAGRGRGAGRGRVGRGRAVAAAGRANGAVAAQARAAAAPRARQVGPAGGRAVAAAERARARREAEVHRVAADRGAARAERAARRNRVGEQQVPQAQLQQPLPQPEQPPAEQAPAPPVVAVPPIGDPIYALEDDDLYDPYRSATPSPVRHVELPVAQPQQVVVQVNEGPMCLDCRTAKALFVMQPCGHLALCNACNTSAVIHNRVTCPMGAVCPPVTDRIRSYY
ncbi:uncharacterized protein LOC127750786 [Frankliniella occidentalis]|uniref:Uncharacterized protein LOC127750786 n=1 Tax=Frankliniella occidentalis TaxID=133901 RepID=A0A9C6X4X6_FRAOC|nr:uncharacterized protein LOC127750786 [Frankliniella occidentalis]